MVLRPMTEADVSDVVAKIQEPGSVASLAEVFPQEEFPFPRDDVAQRWYEEIRTPGIDCSVATLFVFVLLRIGRSVPPVPIATGSRAPGSPCNSASHDTRWTRTRMDGGCSSVSIGRRTRTPS